MIRQLCVVGVFYLVPALALAAEYPRLQGDPDAVAAIERMLERLGGRDVWARTRSLYVEYEGWRSDPAQPVVERAWRDVVEPNQRVVFEGRTFEVTFLMTREQSWLDRSGSVTGFSADDHRNNLSFWNYDFYTIIRNLAVGDPRIRLTFEPPRTVRIRNTDGDDWGWWEIDATGAPLRWGALDRGEPLEYIYGPVTAFGNINFPAWGTASDASWRFNYTKVDVSTQPLTVPVTP